MISSLPSKPADKSVRVSQSARHKDLQTTKELRRFSTQPVKTEQESGSKSRSLPGSLESESLMIHREKEGGGRK